MTDKKIRKTRNCQRDAHRSATLLTLVVLGLTGTVWASDPPAPTNPVPANPAPSNPIPANPMPTEPTPTAPADPTPAVPTPTAPTTPSKPAEPLPMMPAPNALSNGNTPVIPDDTTGTANNTKKGAITGIGKDGKAIPIKKKRASVFRRTGDNGETISPAEMLLGSAGKGLQLSGNMSVSALSDAVSGGSLARSQYLNGGNSYSGGSYNSFSTYGQATSALHSNADVTVSGKLFNLFTVNARVSNQRYGNYYNQTFGFNYVHKATKVDVGDVRAGIDGNDLVSFNRTLRGIAFSQGFTGKQGTLNLSGVASQTRALARHGSFQGQGTTGPYYLNVSSIIEGTDRIILNGKELKRDEDYQIDYQLGQVSFLSGRIINSGDTVEYGFEAQGYNASAGTLTGMRLNLAPTKGPTLGITLLNQKAAGKVNGNTQLLERFPVYPDLTYKYQLASRIQETTPVEIRWKESLLVEGIDYTLNRSLAYFTLRKAIPPDTSLTGDISLSIKYEPVRESGIGGDRSVTGLDTNFRVGSSGQMGIQYARSASQVGAGNGAATKINATLHSPGKSPNNRWTLSTNWSDVGFGFSPLDSVSSSLQRASKGVSANLNYTLTPGLDFTSSWSNSRVPNSTTTTTVNGTTTTSPVTWSTSDSLNFGATINLGGKSARERNDAADRNNRQRQRGNDSDGTLAGTAGQPIRAEGFSRGSNNGRGSNGFAGLVDLLPTLHFSHQQTTQKSPTVGSTSLSTFNSDSMTLGWQRGIFKLDGEIAQTVSKGASVFLNGYNNAVSTSTNAGTLLDQARNGTYSSTVNDSRSNTSRINLGVKPLYWLTLNGNIGFSQTKYGANSSAASNSSSNGRDTGMDITITPQLPNNGLLNIVINLADSNNGQSTSYFYNNTSSTTGTTGQSVLGGQISGQRTQSTDLAITYQPSAKLGINFGTRQQLSLIPGSDSSQNRYNTLGVTTSLIKGLPINAQFSSQSVHSVGGQSDSSYNSWQVDTAFALGKLTMRPSISQITSNAATYYNGSTNGGSTSGVLSTKAAGSTLIQQQKSLTWTMLADYPIGGGKTINFRYDEIDAHSPIDNSSSIYGSSSGGAYHSSTNYKRGTGSIGLSFPVLEFFTFSINANIIDVTDRDDRRYSYRANAFSMDLSAHF